MSLLIRIGDKLGLPEPVIVFDWRAHAVRKTLKAAGIQCFVCGYRENIFFVKHVNVTVKRGCGIKAVIALRQAGFDAWPRNVAHQYGKV